MRSLPAPPNARPTRPLVAEPEIRSVDPSLSMSWAISLNVPFWLRPQRTSRATLTVGGSSTGVTVIVSRAMRCAPPSSRARIVTAALPNASGAGVNVSSPFAETAG